MRKSDDFPINERFSRGTSMNYPDTKDVWVS